MLLLTGGTRCSTNAAPAARVSRVRVAPAVRLATATVFTALTVTGITACGSDNSADSDGAGDSAATVSAAQTTDGSGHEHSPTAPPAPQELQAGLDGFVDPAKPTADKANLVVDGQRRTANIDTMTQGLAGYGAITFDVSDVHTEGDTATAQVVVTSPHGAAPAMPMTWKHSGNAWQISDESACTILAMGRAPCQN